MPHLKRKYQQVNGVKLSYLDNCVQYPDKTIIIFPQGIDTGRHVASTMGLDEPGVRTIYLDFPGRGDSEPLPEFESVETIARYMYQFIKEIGPKKPIIAGASLGTAIINEMMTFADEDDFEMIILIAPGEFFGPLVRPVLCKFAGGVVRHKRIKNLYIKAVTKWSQNGEELLNELDWNSIAEQLYSALEYKIDVTKPIMGVFFFLLLSSS